jgi:hypothetical protein
LFDPRLEIGKKRSYFGHRCGHTYISTLRKLIYSFWQRAHTQKIKEKKDKKFKKDKKRRVWWQQTAYAGWACTASAPVLRGFLGGQYTTIHAY